MSFLETVKARSGTAQRHEVKGCGVASDFLAMCRLLQVLISAGAFPPKPLLGLHVIGCSHFFVALSVALYEVFGQRFWRQRCRHMNWGQDLSHKTRKKYGNVFV